MIPSPLQYLSAFAIAFVAGAVSVASAYEYGKWMKDAGRREVGR